MLNSKQKENLLATPVPYGRNGQAHTHARPREVTVDISYQI